MADYQHFTSESMIEALRQTNGLVSLAAKRLGCAPKTIYVRAKEVQAVKQVIDDARAELVDIAELALRKCLTEQQPWAVAITLRTLGKNRGYVERQEVTGADGEPIGVKVTAIDYRSTLAPLAPGSVADSNAPGEGQSALDGAALG